MWTWTVLSLLQRLPCMACKWVLSSVYHGINDNIQFSITVLHPQDNTLARYKTLGRYKP